MDIWRRDHARVSRIQQPIEGSTLTLCSLFLFGSYETRRDIPKYLSWLFKPDCVDLVWYVAAKLSIQRPEYLSNESDLEFDRGAVVTSYRILISAAVVFLGSIKITFAYLSSFIGAIWVEWLLAAFVFSSCVNFNLAQVNQTLNYENPPLDSTSLVYMKITR
jgi:hypothetical protein